MLDMIPVQLSADIALLPVQTFTVHFRGSALAADFARPTGHATLHTITTGRRAIGTSAEDATAIAARRQQQVSIFGLLQPRGDTEGFTILDKNATVDHFHAV
jgi:hypothetical protein